MSKASIYKPKGTKVWHYRFSIAGQKFRKTTKTTDSEYAQVIANKAYAKQYELSIHEKAHGVPLRHTWAEVSERYWIETEEEGGKVKSTLSREAQILNWLAPHWDNFYLDEIDKQEILRIRSLKFQRSKSTSQSDNSNRENVNRYLAVIGRILKIAYERWEWIDKVPKIEKFKVNHLLKDVPTDEELWRVFAELPEHLKRPFLFHRLTSVREGNGTGLKWSYVDFDRNCIIYPGDELKNRSPYRLELFTNVKTILKQCIGQHPEYVFTYKGKPIKKFNSTAFQDACKRAGVKMNWHTLRHCWTTAMIKVAPKEIVKQLGGWKTNDMVDRYSHLSNDFISQYAKLADMEGLGPFGSKAESETDPTLEISKSKKK